MSEEVSVDRLPDANDLPAGHQVIELPMTAVDRRRVRRRVEAPDGTVLALRLPTGTLLRPGQVLHVDGVRAYVVAAADEDVLLVLPRDIREAARAGHFIGNLHRDMDVDGDLVMVLWDGVIEEGLRTAGFEVARARRPFRGAAPGDHQH